MHTAIQNIVDIAKNVQSKKRQKDINKKKQYINKQKIQCAKCGETRIYTLDFHHKDESKKEFNIGRLKKGSLGVIQKEINKCIVLCSNCHREFHYFANQNNMILEEYLSNNTPS